MLDNAKARATVTRTIDPLISILVRLRVTPDAVTWFGALGTCIASGLLIARGSFLIGAIILIVLSLSDLIDGALARRYGSANAWGAFLDSTLDRVADAAVVIAITYFFAQQGGHDGVVIAGFVALVAGQLISYTRAKAEGIGVQCTVGLAERAERSIIVLTGLVLAGLGLNVLPATVVVLATVSVVTVFQRVHHVYTQTTQ